jgi:thiol-disulfide isomerase/thioredoxin
VNDSDTDTLAREIQWHVCKNTNIKPRGSDTQPAEIDPASAGFTCGLWMLFHYLTVAANIHFVEHIQRLGQTFYAPTYNIYEHRSPDTVTFLVQTLLSPNANVEPLNGQLDVDIDDEAQFRRSLVDTDVGLIMFYADWCIHCKFAVYHYQTLAQRLHSHTISFSAVNCVVMPDVCTHYNVESYPTLILIDGSESNADNERMRRVTLGHGVEGMAALEAELRSITEVYVMGSYQNLLSLYFSCRKGMGGYSLHLRI